jgi:hypothetical protein
VNDRRTRPNDDAQERADDKKRRDAAKRQAQNVAAQRKAKYA